MCLAPKMPAPPAPPPPPPAPVTSTEVTTVKPTISARKSLQQASRGTSSLTIPLSTGGSTTGMSNLAIGK